MIRPTTPIMQLAQPVSRQVSQTRVSGFDFAFILTAGLVIVGGCFVMLELAASRSSGQESVALNYLTQACAWLPAMATAAGKYLLLFLASVVNSALIVLLVQSLRTMDRRVRRSPRLSMMGGYTPVARKENVRGKRAHTRRATVVEASNSRPFLLSPVFR